MGMVINRSNRPESAIQLRKSLLDSGATEAFSIEEMQRLEEEGKTAFVDFTENGTCCFSQEEMDDFRSTPIEGFLSHLRRWGH